MKPALNGMMFSFGISVSCKHTHTHTHTHSSGHIDLTCHYLFFALSRDTHDWAICALTMYGLATMTMMVMLMVMMKEMKMMITIMLLKIIMVKMI